MSGRLTMPKIDAPTVAEHHSRRRAALLAAGADILAAHGAEAVTLAAVGAAAGLARSSVYQYFGSAPELLAAVVEDAFPRATDRLRAAAGQAGTPAARIDAYLLTALAMATEPAHRALYALGRTPMPDSCRARLAELHDDLYAPLRAAIAELATPDPELTTRLVLGLLSAASQAVTDGTPVDRVQQQTLSLLHAGLAGLASGAAR